MSGSVRIGVIGCGFYAQNHLNAWRDLASEGADVTAVCDIDPTKANAAAAAFGVPAFTDPAAMIETTHPDAVDIVTRHDTHRILAELAISHGIAVIVQKPFATTWADCLGIVEAAEAAGVWLAVHENFRFQTPMRRARELVTSGELGTPNWARISFRTGFDVYKTQPYFYDEERLVIADVGIHMLDLSRFFMGEVRHLACETQRRNPQVRAEDTATMMLRHDSGAVSVVECTYEARRLPDPFPETIAEIECSEGSVVVEPGCRLRVTRHGRAELRDVATPLLPWTTARWHTSQEGTLNACRHFLCCLRDGVSAETSGSDNLKSFALLDAAYRAAAEGRLVSPVAWRPDRL